jgi:hypothetical protein
MNIERMNLTVLRITLHTYEMAALISAARWVTEGAEGNLPDEAVDQIEKVLESYDTAKQGLSILKK